MRKASKKSNHDTLRKEYDLSKLRGAVRGKYFRRYQAGTNLVLLAPDVARVFHDDEAVNTTLRSLIGIARAQAKRAA